MVLRGRDQGSGIRDSALGVGRWALGAGRWALGAGRWALGAGRWDRILPHSGRSPADRRVRSHFLTNSRGSPAAGSDMARINTYRDLQVWQRSMQVTLACY